MDPTSVNSFLDQFIATADAGFGAISGDINYVLNALIIISVTLSFMQWALAGEAPMAPLFRKILYVGFFAWLVNNWASLSTIIHRSGAMLGIQAGGGGLTLADLHNPARLGGIGIELFGRTVALAEGMNLLFDFISLMTIFIAAVFIMLGFFVLALQIFISLLAFKLGSLAAFVCLPWGVFNGTAWIAKGPLGWVVGSCIRLFILALIASASILFVNTLPATLTLDAGGALQVLFVGLFVLGAAWFGPSLAAEVTQGTPHFSGADAWRSAVGGAFTGLGASYVAYQGGKNLIGGARALIKGGARLAAGSRPSSSGGGSGGSGAQPRAINYAAMQPRPSQNNPSNGGNP
jgi:type IV secretion system protein TrbL